MEIKKEELQNLKASDYAELFEKHKTTIELDSFDWDLKERKVKTHEIMVIPQFTMDEPLEVENYPYGRLRTTMRYSVETTKRGDRFVSQTRNPKTGVWNKPKKSTYSEVMMMYINSKGHITYTSISYNDKELNINNKLELFKGLMTKEQKIQVARVQGYTETMKSVSFEIKPRLFKHQVSGEITQSVDIMKMSEYDECDENGALIDKHLEKKRKKETDKIINSNIGYNSQKAFLKMSEGDK